MEEAKSPAQQQQQQQQQQLMLQQQQQQQHNQHQQQLLLMQQIQQQKHQQQQLAMARFPSNIDAHLRASSALRQQSQSQQQQIPNNPNPNSSSNSNYPSIPNQQQNPSSSSNSQQMQQKVGRSPPAANQAELQMAYQDLWRVCHPEHKRPFSSLEDACERLLPYHVVADYEAEEDDRILDSDTTGQMLSRSQQWDHNIAAKVAEFAATFEKQVYAFNIISRKRALGEFRSEERLMLEQILLHEERRALVELRSEMDSRQKAGREAHEANLRMAAMVHAQQARAESQVDAEMMARAPIRPNALGSQGSNIPICHDMVEEEQEVNPEDMINGWGNIGQRDEKEEPSEDFLNDEETENGDADVGEFDLNTR